MFIDICLDVRKQGGTTLCLIQDGAIAKLVQKATRVCFGKFPLIEIFKRYITVPGKGMPYQCGLAGLAWPGDHYHWITVGEVLKPGFCVSRDVGHYCFCLLYMTALCAEMANCQLYLQLAILAPAGRAELGHPQIY